MYHFAIQYHELINNKDRVVIVSSKAHDLAQSIRDYMDNEKMYIPKEFASNPSVITDIEIDSNNVPYHYKGINLYYITSSTSGKMSETVDIW